MTYTKYNGEPIASVLQELSAEGLLNVLNGYDHINLFGDEEKADLEKIAQCNLISGGIDEIEFILELDSE